MQVPQLAPLMAMAALLLLQLLLAARRRDRSAQQRLQRRRQLLCLALQPGHPHLQLLLPLRLLAVSVERGRRPLPLLQVVHLCKR